MKRTILSIGSLIGAAALAVSLVSPGEVHAKKDKGNKGAKAHRKSGPPGWSQGRKTGWGGRSLPPGQAKKRDRERYDDDRYDRDRYERGRYDRDEYDRDRDRDRDRYDRDRYERGRYDRDDRRRNRNRNSSSFTGTVVNDSDRFSRSITIRSSDGDERRINVGRTVPIYRNGSRISVHEIREGEIVRVRYATDANGNRPVTRIDVIGRR